MKSKRIYEYDIVRMLATYSVVIVHVSAMALEGYVQGSPVPVMMILLNRLLKFTTPVFVFLAATLVCEKYKKEIFKFMPFIKGRFKRILLPYVLVSLIYTLGVSVVSGKSSGITDYLEQLFFGSAQYHLYFIPIIIQLYILTPVFLWLKKYVNKYALIIISAGLNIYVALYIVFTYSDRIFLKYLFPFMLGIIYGGEIIGFVKKSQIRIYGIIAVTLAFGLSYSYQFVLSYYAPLRVNVVFTAFLWFVYCSLSCINLTWIASLLVKNEKIKKSAKSISAVSYYIYLYHPIFLSLTVKGLNELGIYSMTSRFGIAMFVVLVVATVFAFVASEFGKRISDFLEKTHKKNPILKKEIN